ncbi:MAG: hypothetical protein AAF761_00800, partial [Pseudomonadota bacterium]
MAAGPELREFRVNLNETRRNINEVKRDVRDVENTVKDARKALEYAGRIERQADDFGKDVDAMLLTLKVMDKAGPFKLVANFAKPVLDKLKDVAGYIERKAAQIDDRVQATGYIQRLETAEEKLADLREDLAETSQKVEGLRDDTDDLIDTFDIVDDLDGSDNVLAGAEATADAFVAPLNTVLEGLNNTYGAVRSEIDDLQAAFSATFFQPVLSVAAKFDVISAAMAGLSGPLKVVYSLLKPIEPVLNIVGFLFKITVEPVLNFITEKTGINALLDKLAGRISAALPEQTLLDDVLDGLDATMDGLGSLGDLNPLDGWDLDLTSILSDFVDDVFGEFGDDPGDTVRFGTAASETLLGTAATDVLNPRGGDDVTFAYGGDDLILASPGDDTTYGGGGEDRMRFRGDFTEYSFIAGEDGGPITFYHDNPSGRRSMGAEEVHDVGMFLFNDVRLSYDDLVNNVQQAAPGQTTMTGTAGNDFFFARTTSITIEGLAGDDRMVGSDAVDTFYGGAGNDVFLSQGGGDTVYGGDGRDTWVFGNQGGGGLIEADLAAGTIFDGSGSDFVSGVENIRVQDPRVVTLRGDGEKNRLMGNRGDDYIDGRGGRDKIFGGDGNDLLVGGTGRDEVYGGDGFDIMVAGGPVFGGLGDSYDGGASDDMLVYSQLWSEYDVRTDRVSSPDPQEPSGPLRIFTGEGRVERLNAAGTEVRAEDLFRDIRQIVGSDETDTVYGYEGAEIFDTYTVDGGGGDDVIYSGGSRLVSGGRG